MKVLRETRQEVRQAMNSEEVSLPEYLKFKLSYGLLAVRSEDTESLSFYRKRQNQKVKEGKAYPEIPAIAQAQISFLQRQGLEPSDHLLDIGCGNLRGGRHIIEYLQRGHYTGIDISDAAIEQAWDNLQDWELLHKTPTLFVNEDSAFSEFTDANFDWVFANSVLSHLPEDEIETMFANLDRVLAPTGIACLSFLHTAERDKEIPKHIARSNRYSYPFDDLRELGERHGLRVGHDEYPEYPRDVMQMLLVQRDPSKR